MLPDGTQFPYFKKKLIKVDSSSLDIAHKSMNKMLQIPGWMKQIWIYEEKKTLWSIGFHKGLGTLGFGF